MTGPITFTLPEVIDLIQTRDALAEENQALRGEVDRLRTENQVLREQVEGYWQERRKSRVLPTDGKGFVG